MLSRILLNVTVLLATAATLYSPARAVNPPIGLRQFGELIRGLSEPEGYFDSDNFVSNEAAYLRVLPALRRLGVHSGAYIGVGPDQNYSYIAEIDPEIAFIIDIRRQNLLQHLYLKALFQLSADRAEYLERLFGRPIGREEGLTRASPERLLELADKAPLDRDFRERSLAEAAGLIRSWNLGLTQDDMHSIAYVAGAFVEGGPDLKFTSHYRPPRAHHPSYRTLMLETDSSATHAHYLADEHRFQTVKRLHDANRIVPLVGDFAGVGALRRTALELRRRGLQVTCLYISNVEFYLFRGERWAAYVDNIRSLPWSENGCIIRSYANIWRPHPAQVPGYYMSTLLQPVRAFLSNEDRGRNPTYWEMVTQDYLAR